MRRSSDVEMNLRTSFAQHLDKVDHFKTNARALASCCQLGLVYVEDRDAVQLVDLSPCLDAYLSTAHQRLSHHYYTSTLHRPRSLDDYTTMHAALMCYLSLLPQTPVRSQRFSCNAFAGLESGCHKSAWL